VNAASETVYTGFVAQEVQAAANKFKYDFNGVDKPKTQGGLYGLRYSEFVVPLVKAVQDLSRMNDEKDARIDSLENQFAELKNLVLKMQQAQQQCSPCSAALNNGLSQQNMSQLGVELTNAASLEQNIPNPFNNTTVINYTLPGKFNSAQIIITDKSGKTLQQLKLESPGKGMVHVDAPTLAAGAYNYTLYVDGKIVGSRQMVLAK
jgi:hypothetical protein